MNNPVGNAIPPPPAFSRPPMPPPVEAAAPMGGFEGVDSKGYLMDILNLSVDLDPDDDDEPV